MRILYVSKEMRNPQRLINVYPRLYSMPCEVFWARDNQAVVQYIQKADVIFLNMVKETQWLAPDSPIYKSSIPTARFFGDVWKIPGVKKESAVNRKQSLRRELFRDYDMRITPTNWLFRKNCPEWVDSMFWSPHCIDVQDYPIPRDINVLFWGRADAAAGYTTRARAKALVKTCITSQGRPVDTCLTMYDIKLHKRRYNLAMLKPRLHSGTKLYKLLSRTRVCCIAPPDCSVPGGKPVGAPVGKFFENAACGAVSLTTDFTDRERLGFEHGKNIWITTLDRYVRDLDYLLRRPALINEISKNAKELIRTRHTPKIRGRKLYKFLRKRTGKK